MFDEQRDVALYDRLGYQRLERQRVDALVASACVIAT